MGEPPRHSALTHGSDARGRVLTGDGERGPMGGVWRCRGVGGRRDRLGERELAMRLGAVGKGCGAAGCDRPWTRDADGCQEERASRWLILPVRPRIGSSPTPRFTCGRIKSKRGHRPRTPQLDSQVQTTLGSSAPHTGRRAIPRNGQSATGKARRQPAQYLLRMIIAVLAGFNNQVSRRRQDGVNVTFGGMHIDLCDRLGFRR